MRLISARLSARRRHPLAGVLVVLMGLLFTGGAYAVLSPATAEDTTSDAELIAQGRELYLVGCSSCHGLNAEGVSTKRGNWYGPSLIGVGAAAVDFQVGTGRMPMAQPGAQAPRKAPLYTEAETRALAAYVASLGPGAAIPEPSAYDISDADEESVVRGGEFFRTNCTACHNFAASGGAMPWGKFAPTLMGVDEKHMYEAMLTGPQSMPVFSDDVLTPEDKRDIIAFLKSLENQPKYGGFTLGALGPVSEGLFVWVVGIGALVGFACWIGTASARTTKKKMGS